MLGQQKFSPSSFGAVFGSGIRDKHPGSATLVPRYWKILHDQGQGNYSGKGLGNTHGQGNTRGLGNTQGQGKY